MALQTREQVRFRKMGITGVMCRKSYGMVATKVL